MISNDRLERVLVAVETRGFASVKELSELCNVSEATIRRDLDQLHGEGRLRRTHGGAAAREASNTPTGPAISATFPIEGGLADRVDVLVATPVDTDFDRALLDRAGKRGIPIVAESASLVGAATLVATDSHAAGRALGFWAGAYASQYFAGQARLLDLTFHLENTQARSRAFVSGLREAAPASQVVLSIDAGSTCKAARQLTGDVLDVHPEINMVFAINDTTGCGALQACTERGIACGDVALLTFGLEGDTLLEALTGASFCKAAVAMFPEIVGPVCVEAAIQAYLNQPLPKQLVTPYAVLTAETVRDFYFRGREGWQLNWPAAMAQLHVPLEIRGTPHHTKARLPRRIGFVVPFSEHEWYQNLARGMRDHANRLGIELEVIDAERHRRDDVMQREREVARVAAAQVKPGDVILIDGGQVTAYLAEELAGREGITVITNSRSVLDILRDRANLTLISTGGVLRRFSDGMSGRNAELALRDLRADKLFLTATGVTLDFGLSHTSLPEVAVKQAMIQAAREVILLADHTKFGQASGAQIARLSEVTKVITDSALPANTRLELSKSGIEVITAGA